MPALATRPHAEASLLPPAAGPDFCGGAGAIDDATSAAAAGAAPPRPPAGPLPLRALNHVSLCVRDVAKSAAFYAQVLGFVEVRRPACFDFDGSW